MAAPLWLSSFLDASGTDDCATPTGAAYAQAELPHATDDPDAVQLTRIRQGDESALRAVWESYYGRLVSFASRYVHSTDIAADVVQHTFITLWRNRASLQPRGTLASYLFAAVRHRAWNVIKHDRIVQRHATEQLQDTPASARNLGEFTVETDELIAEAVRLLGTLPPRTREILLMHREDDMSPAQIAAVLGIAPQTVYNQLTRATKVLAQGLERWRQTLG